MIPEVFPDLFLERKDQDFLFQNAYHKAQGQSYHSFWIGVDQGKKGLSVKGNPALFLGVVGKLTMKARLSGDG